ncbi:unnamed protein product [Thlaspi arvense]|uniref:F-box domain-containing protein n=1 Tax=Thlaspi arvense TaxID=13288 RepID=A0AAU9RBY7_THLAR|nr:unnamed protein product [Thlaspi arvense]
MESLPHHIVERILERLEVKPLLRFKAVSKQWRSTIESPFFQERQLKHRQQSGDPDVLMVSAWRGSGKIESLSTLVLGSSSSVKIPTPWEEEDTQYLVSFNSCDGLVCLYNPLVSGFVVNPATRWHRPLPLCGLQQLMVDLGNSYFELGHALFKLGFGKDKFTGTYKPVWLYNSAEIGRENATTCEVFDFSTNAWRYVTPAAPYRLAVCADPAFVDGSLYWFTDCEETKVVSLDLHTEAFQVLSKAPFAANPHRKDNPYEIVMCNLDNRLCVSEKKGSNQVIWSFNAGNKTWDKICSIDLDITSIFYNSPTLCAFLPLALLDGKNKKTKKKNKNLLFYDLVKGRELLTLDPENSSFVYVAFDAEHFFGYPVFYFQSLISI